MLRKRYASSVRKLFIVHLREYPDVPDRLHYEALAEEEIAGRGGVEFPKILKALKKMATRELWTWM